MTLPQIGDYVIYTPIKCDRPFVGLVTDVFDDFFIVDLVDYDDRMEIVAWNDDWKVY